MEKEGRRGQLWLLKEADSLTAGGAGVREAGDVSRLTQGTLQPSEDNSGDCSVGT